MPRRTAARSPTAPPPPFPRRQPGSSVERLVQIRAECVASRKGCHRRVSTKRQERAGGRRCPAPTPRRSTGASATRPIGPREGPFSIRLFKRGSRLQQAARHRRNVGRTPTLRRAPVPLVTGSPTGSVGLGTFDPRYRDSHLRIEHQDTSSTARLSGGRLGCLHR